MRVMAWLRRRVEMGMSIVLGVMNMRVTMKNVVFVVGGFCVFLYVLLLLYLPEAPRIRQSLQMKKGFFYTVAVTMVSNSLVFYLPEWIEHHSLLGINHFIIFSNHVSDNSSTLILLPYIQNGLVSLVNYPPPLPDNYPISSFYSSTVPAGLVSSLNDHSEDYLNWFHSGDRSEWLNKLKACRKDIEFLRGNTSNTFLNSGRKQIPLQSKFNDAEIVLKQCFEAALLETLASWRHRCRWLIALNVDEFLYVPLPEGSNSINNVSDIPKLSSVLKQNENKDMITIIGANFGTQGFLTPPDESDIETLFPIITDKYTHRARIPFRLDKPIYGLAESRKSFVNPAVASGTKISEWTFTKSVKKNPSILRIRPSSTMLRLCHFGHRSMLSDVIDGHAEQRCMAGGVKCGLGKVSEMSDSFWGQTKSGNGYSPITDAFLHEIKDVGISYLTPFVRENLRNRVRDNTWPQLKTYWKSIKLLNETRVMSKTPKLCIAVSHHKASLPQFRKTILSLLFHIQYHEPDDLTFELVAAGGSSEGSIEALNYAGSLPWTAKVKKLDGKWPRMAEVLDVAYSLCTAKYVLSVVDEWETRLGVSEFEIAKLMEIWKSNWDTEMRSYDSHGLFNQSSSISNSDSSEEKSELFEKRGGLWNPTISEYHNFTHAILATTLHLLESIPSVLEVWVGDVPSTVEYGNSRIAAGNAGLWREYVANNFDKASNSMGFIKPYRTRILIRSQRASNPESSDTVTTRGWFQWCLSLILGRQAAYKAGDVGNRLSSKIQKDSSLGIYRSGGSVKNLEEIRRLGNVSQFLHPGTTDFEAEMLFANKAGQKGLGSLQFCLSEEMLYSQRDRHMWDRWMKHWRSGRERKRDPCSMDPDEIGDGDTTTGIMWRSRVLLNSLWWGEQSGFTDREAAPMCYRFFGIDIWCI